MASPIFLQELLIEQLQQISPQDVEQTLKAEQLYFKNLPKTNYYLAVNGSKTKSGGLVKASVTQAKINGLSITRVGDSVIYADGTITTIVSGALVGSHLNNGDEVIDSPNNKIAISIFKGETLSKGFLTIKGVDHG